MQDEEEEWSSIDYEIAQDKELPDIVSMSDPSTGIVCIKPNVTVISKAAFKGSSVIASLCFERPIMLTSIGPKAFMFSTVKSVVIPSTVETLKSHCFAFCQSLCNLKFEKPCRLTALPVSGFISSGIVAISIPASVQVIESECFAGSESLKILEFEENSELTSIEEQAFAGSSIRELWLPKGIKRLGDMSFGACSKLIRIVFPSFESRKTIELGDKVFGECHLVWPTSFAYANEVGTCPYQSSDFCSFEVTGNSYVTQKWWHCPDCEFASHYGICQYCAMNCHREDKRTFDRVAESCFCDCGARKHNQTCKEKY